MSCEFSKDGLICGSFAVAVCRDCEPIKHFCEFHGFNHWQIDNHGIQLFDKNTLSVAKDNLKAIKKTKKQHISKIFQESVSMISEIKEATLKTVQNFKSINKNAKTINELNFLNIEKQNIPFIKKIKDSVPDIILNNKDIESFKDENGMLKRLLEDTEKELETLKNENQALKIHFQSLNSDMSGLHRKSKPHEIERPSRADLGINGVVDERLHRKSKPNEIERPSRAGLGINGVVDERYEYKLPDYQGRANMNPHLEKANLFRNEVKIPMIAKRQSENNLHSSSIKPLIKHLFEHDENEQNGDRKSSIFPQRFEDEW